MQSPERVDRNGGEYGIDQELPSMTPDHRVGDSRLEIVQPNSNEKTPNLMVNKNPLG